MVSLLSGNSNDIADFAIDSTLVLHQILQLPLLLSLSAPLMPLCKNTMTRLPLTPMERKVKTMMNEVIEEVNLL